MTYDEMLLEACKKGSLDDVDRLLSLRMFLIFKRTNVHAVDMRGQTPLEIASANGHKEIAELLIARGANVNARDKERWTPLHSATASGHLEIAELLITRGANIDASDADDCTPLRRAMEAGHLHIAELLINKGAHLEFECGFVPRWTELRWAIEQDLPKMVDLLIERGADSNIILRIPSSLVEISPLHWALEKSYFHTAELLIARGSDVNAPDNFERTPLWDAICRDHTEAAEFLIAKGADVNTPGPHRCPPLELALHKGHIHIAEILIDKGADPNAEFKSFISIDRNEGFVLVYTPLQWAVAQDHAHMVELLIAKGADVNAPFKYGDPLLQWATKQHMPRMVELLIANGANPKASKKQPAQMNAVHGTSAVRTDMPSSLPLARRTLRPEDGARILYFPDAKTRDFAYHVLSSQFPSRFSHIERRNVTNRRVMYQHWIVCNSQAYDDQVQDRLAIAGYHCPESQFVDYSRATQDSDPC